MTTDALHQIHGDSTYDCIVVGAGVVGCAIAFALARDGRKVVLLERDVREPDRIVGELLQPGGVHALEQLGLGSCLDGIDAITVQGYGVFQGDRTVHLPYPEKPGSSNGSMEYGKSFHHGRFIMSLREACKHHPNITLQECTVSELLTDPRHPDTVVGVCATQKAQVGDGATETVEFRAPLTFLVDGCFSKFRKEIPHEQVFVRSHFVGAILHDCPLPMPNHGHVILADPSPILLYQIGTHDTRILVDIPGKLPSAGTGALKQYMIEKVLPQLPKQTQKSFLDAVESQRLRVMPNSFLPAAPNRRRGCIVLGDALNMRHPLTGGGMTVGLWDALTLSRLLQPANVPDLSDHSRILQQLGSFHWQRKSHSSVINILAQALYELFSAGENPDLQVLREACFAYFCLGGIHIRHPIGLLAGLIQSPLTLFAHFFAVAFLGVFRLLLTPVGVLQPLLIPPTTLAEFEKNVVVRPVLAASNWILLATTLVLSLPVNLLYGGKVLVTATGVLARYASAF